MTPFEAANAGDFCSTLVQDANGEESLELKHTHPYYCQVQGQMAIMEREWCDFILYTGKAINVERVTFDSDFWNNKLLPKLIDFYDNCLAPEIVCLVHVLGIPVGKLRDM